MFNVVRQVNTQAANKKAMSYQVLFALLCTLIVSGCAVKTARPPVADQPLEHWQITGRFSIKTPQDSFFSNLYWSLTPKIQEFRLYNSLGQTLAKLTESANGAKVHIHKKGEFKGENGDILLKELLGYHIPVSTLKYWAQGIPTPGAKNISKNEDGTLSQLTYQNWTVNYHSYRKVDGRLLPKSIRIEGNDSVIKLSLHRWKSLQ